MVAEFGRGRGLGRGSGPINWKGENVGNIPGTGGEHDEPIDTEGYAGAFGQSVLERSQQPFVDRDLRQTEVSARLEIRSAMLQP